jgi:hypothetical protein
MLRTAQAADTIGARVLLVHAKDDNAKAFYEHFTFEVSPSDPYHLLLIMKDFCRSSKHEVCGPFASRPIGKAHSAAPAHAGAGFPARNVRATQYGRMRALRQSGAPVAQLDRVLGYEPRGREFESLRARHFLQNSGLDWRT